MASGIDTGDFAGVSAALAYYAVVCSVGLGCLIWRYRTRFYGWWDQSPLERSDSILHIAMFGIFVIAAIQKIVATYSFAAQEWTLSALAIATAPFYHGGMILFTAAFLWWLCMELFGPPSNRVWWISFVGTGAWIGAAISWRY